MTEHDVKMYLFETTNLTMWAEDVARERSIPAEVAPAPPEAKDSCGLSLRTPAAHAPALEAAMEEEGIAYHTLDDARNVAGAGD